MSLRAEAALLRQAAAEKRIRAAREALAVALREGDASDAEVHALSLLAHQGAADAAGETAAMVEGR